MPFRLGVIGVLLLILSLGTASQVPTPPAQPDSGPGGKQAPHVSDSDIAATKLAGFTDAEIVDIVANVALNVLTNFLGVVAQTDIDFPVVRAEAA